MRSSSRISRTPRQWRDHQEEERRRIAAALLSELAAARARGEEWIAWIDAGCPQLTAEEYEACGGLRGKPRSSSRRSSSAQAAL